MVSVAPARRSAAASAVLVGVVLTGATVINQSAVHWRSNNADSDLFAYYGWCVARGARPYLDVWDNKPPGMWWVHAAAVRLCGAGAASELLAGSAGLAIALTAFVGIARTAYHRSVVVPAAVVAAVLLTELRFECGANRTETWVAACESAAILGYLRWLRRRRWGWLFAGGLAAGAAPLFKQSGLAAAAACALHLAWVQRQTRATQAGRSPASPYLRGWKPWVVGGAGLAALPLAAVVALAWQGALGEAVNAVAVFNRAYFAVGDATWWRMDRVWPVYRPVLGLLAPVCGIVAIGLGCGAYMRFRRWRKTAGTGGAKMGRVPRRGVGLMVLWLLLAAYLAFAGPGRRGHHFMPALPALGLLVLYPVHLLAARRGLRAMLTARPSAVAGVVAGGYVLVLLLAGSLAEAGRCWLVKPHWYALHRTQPSACERQAAEIAKLTQPGDAIYVWGWSPGTYRYACRRPASRYATFEKLGQVGKHADFILERAQDDIRRSRPEVIAIAPEDYEQLARPPAGEFGAWLRREYETVTTVEGMHVLRRGDKVIK